MRSPNRQFLYGPMIKKEEIQLPRSFYSALVNSLKTFKSILQRLIAQSYFYMVMKMKLSQSKAP